jgi:hypothetical protein
MNYKIIGSYPTTLDSNQLKSYISVLLNIAAVDGISKKEMDLIEQLAKDANVSSELLEECIISYKSFDLTRLPDYNKQWVYCILRDAILISDCDNGISDDEKSYLSKISDFSGIGSDFEKVLKLTLSQKRDAEEWEALLSA